MNLEIHKNSTIKRNIWVYSSQSTPWFHCFVWDVSKRLDYTSYVQNSAYNLIGVGKGIFYNHTPMRILIHRKREAKLQSWRYINYFISCCTKHDSTREKHNYLMSNFLGSFDRLIIHTKIGTKPALKIILKLINVSHHL